MPSADFKRSWAPAAQKDLDDLYDYYSANVSDRAVESLLRDIDRAAERIAARPFSGTPRPNLAAGLRTVRIAPYLLFYRITDDTVEFVRVLHERRDLSAALNDRDV